MKYCIYLIAFLAFLFAPSLTQAQSEMVSANPPFQSALSPNSLYTNPAIALDRDMEKCARYKRMKKTGIGLIIGGSVLFVGGIVLMVDGLSESDDFDYDDSGEGKFVLGYLGAILGGTAIGGGTVLTVIGNVKSRKYCDSRRRSSLYLAPTDHGAGLVMTF